MNPAASWNLVQDLREMLAYPFMVNAVRAGTIVAVVAGAAGWVMVLRRESFAGHTLALVGFPGAAAAAWLGIASGYGYFGACVGAAIVIAALPRSVRARGGGEQSAVIGIVQAFALATGMLFVSLYKGFLSGLTNLLFGTIAGVTDGQVVLLLVAAVPCLLLLAVLGRPLLWVSIALLTYYTTHRSGGNGNANVNVLFGSIFGINAAAAGTAALVGAVAIALLLIVSRPLLFATIDPAVARAAGVPTRLLGAVFLAVVGTTVAEATPLVGSVVVLGLLAGPAAAAARLADRPWTAFWSSAALAVLSVWAGITLSYEIPSAPASFTIMTVAACCYLVAFLLDHLRRHRTHATTGLSIS
ncbi:metal ABC transporter permease [Nocardia sp. NPDC059229]|uniref:metal ABC transporter permease n=1 Tax=Nocardia sp. NPDC059229 TaxID=3346778 RepID=UPI0036BA8032